MADEGGKPAEISAAQIEAALAGDEAAASAIRSPETTKHLEHILIGRGASPTEGRDIVADLWADCFAGKNDKPPLLKRFEGKGSLVGFLARSAINRLIDHKRRLRFRGDLPGSTRDEGGTEPADAFDQLPGKGMAPPGEDALVDLLQRALLTAFSKCDPEELVILRLVSASGIGQERVARMWGASQSKISRTLSALMKKIQADTLEEVRRLDPWLEVEWDDFIRLCEGSSDFYSWGDEENGEIGEISA